MFRRRLSIISVCAVSLSSLGFGWSAAPVSAASRAFYVDCVAGSDTAVGNNTAVAWKSITRANQAVLSPGDSLLFKRGCAWSGQALRATWSGTAAAPIIISTYGIDVAKPRLAEAGIVVTGKYLTVDGFQVGFKPVKLDPCGQPLGQYYALVITQGGSHNIITNNLLTQATAGIHISKTAGDYNTIVSNALVGNNVMQEPFDGSGDLGAWGMLVRRSHNNISYNTFRDNRAVCLKGKYYSSNSVEIYEGDFNSIHHNVAENDRVFSELGGSATDKSTDNTYEFNLATSNLGGSRFITTRGAGDTSYGPVMRTIVARNTIYFTGAGSQGLVCSSGCSATILSAKYNIIDVVEKTIYFDKTMGQISNILWSHGSSVKIEDGARNMRTIPPGVTPEAIVANPGFVDPSNGDFRLAPSSPGIDKGGPTNYTTDLQGSPASNGAPDIGAHENGRSVSPIGNGGNVEAAPSASALANTGFEADANDDLRPDSWTSLAPFTTSSEQVHDGVTAGRHFATDNSSYIVKQNVSGLSGGNSYQFGGWVNIGPTTDTFSFKLQVQWRGPTGTIATTTVKNYSSATSGWDEVVSTVAAPAGATNAQIMMNVSSLNASIDVDDFYFGT